MASPHVAGVATLYLQHFPGADASDVNAALVANATPGTVGGAGNGSPNPLLYSRFGGAPPPPPEDVDVTVASHDVVISQNKGNRARGTATVRIVEDATDTGVAGVTVEGTWTGDNAGTGSAPTDLTVQWKDKGRVRADLTWTGGDSTVDIYRDGSPIATVSNSGTYRDAEPGDSYRVCNTGKTTAADCTDDVSRSP